MATLINKYLTVLSDRTDLQFVTLTIPNCAEADVVDQIELMNLTWRKITDYARKKYPQGLNGLRKLELKVGRGGGYHPHYHIIVEGVQAGEYIIDRWLNKLPQANRKAQDIRPINNLEAGLIELMKYATKLTCADNSNGDVFATAKQMDVIFCALNHRRLYQSFGNIKQVNDESMELTAEVYQRAQGIYKWIGHDWFHTRYGHALSGFSPEPSEII